MKKIQKYFSQKTAQSLRLWLYICIDNLSNCTGAAENADGDWASRLTEMLRMHDAQGKKCQWIYN